MEWSPPSPLLPGAAAGASPLLPRAHSQGSARRQADPLRPSGSKLPVPCGDIGAAAGTLWLSGLPPRVTEAALAAECAQFGCVERALVLPGSAAGEGYVAFADITCACRCARAAPRRAAPQVHSLNRWVRRAERPRCAMRRSAATARAAAARSRSNSASSSWLRRGRRPGGAPVALALSAVRAEHLERVCGRQPDAHPRGGRARSWQPQEQVHAWVGSVQSDAGKEEVQLTLRGAGVQRPGVLMVSGVRPGVLLRFASPLLLPPALAALRARMGGVAPAAPALASVASLPLPAAAASLAPPAAGRAPQQPPVVEAGPRTLWVGQVRRRAPGRILRLAGRPHGGLPRADARLQVGPDIAEEELVAAFGRFGTLTGWKFLRRSNCAFIDFQSGAAAAAARAALHGAAFGPWQIRIEFKEELRASGRAGMSAQRSSW